MQLLLEGNMTKTEQFRDAQGVVWINASKVADIWNERARLEYGVEGNYTRWSVREREGKLEALETPLGKLYKEHQARSIALRPRTAKRPDVTQRNKDRSKTDTHSSL